MKHRLFVSFCVFSFFLIEAKAQKNIALRSHLDYQAILSNVWGYYDTATQKEYALVGHEFGLSIVDVTNPVSPQELFFVPGDTSFWREPKTWSHYAYVTNEKGGGLMIVDLGNLPASVNYTYWSGGGQLDYKTSHTPFIDENGILYLNGSKDLFETKGTLMLDLKPDPMNPLFLGQVGNQYIHDCYVRGDTMWASEIYHGTLSVFDVSDKTNPVLLATQTTPRNFTHNCWLSQNGKYIFTTDEMPYSSVACYDVSDLENIKLLDEYRTNTSDSLIPHNTYILPNNYLYTSYYRHGVTIADATKPDNIVEVGWYDTSPFSDDKGFEGCWGVYPFLPSGNILCSDREEGLFVLTPTLKQACRLEGVVTDAATGFALPSVEVEILTSDVRKRTNYLGNYRTGMADAGIYDVRFYRPDICATKILTGVQLFEGAIVFRNVQMSCVTALEERENDSPGLFIPQLTFAENAHAMLHLPESCIGRARFAVTDMLGRNMLSVNPSAAETEVEFGDIWPAGCYLASLQCGDAVIVKKVIKH